MRRMLVQVPLFCSVLLAGGCENALCNLIGDFVGSFEGDLAGEVSAVVSVDPENDEQVIADMELTTADDTTLTGSAPVTCTDGQLVIDLTDDSLASVGEVTGELDDGSAQGLWSLFSGESGTWEY